MKSLRRTIGFIYFFLAIVFFGFVTMIAGLLPGAAPSTYCIRAFGRSALWISGLKLKIRGLEELLAQLKPGEPVIIMANHTSIMDIAILPAAIPLDLRFMYKHTLSYIPIVGWGMVLSGMIPVRRGSKGAAMNSLRKAANQIKKGTPLIIFPEGTRSRTGELGMLKKGGFLLASLAEATLVPVRIDNADQLCHRTLPLCEQGTLEVTVHPAIPFDPSKSKSRKALIQTIQDCIGN